MSSHRNTSGTAPSTARIPFGRLAVLPVLVGCAVALGAKTTPAYSAEPEQWVPGRILVQPKPGLADAELAKILKPHGGKSVGKIDAINVHIVQLPPTASEKAIAALLAKNPHLKFAERDMLVKPVATSNDPYFGSAWHLSKIGATNAWDSTRGDGVTVAVLDTGIDGTHPDLAGQLVTGWNFYDNTPDSSDVYGHGTQVAGTIAAATNNSIGVASVAGNARIMPLRISSTTGSAAFSTMASALTWAADNGADVANISYQSVSGSATVQSAAQYMKNKGGLTVVAAGNTGVEQTFTPSTSMISVSATDANDNRASWSSYGNYVDVSAPGAGIWSTANGGGYQAVSGTSFASPITAAVIALMRSANINLGPADIEQILFSTAVDRGTAGYDKYYGYGRVNAAAAVETAKTSIAADSISPSVSIASPSSGASIKGLTTINVNASDNIGVSRVDVVVNGTSLASDITSPYSFSWDSTKVPDGNVTIGAYAYDAAGNYSSNSVTVKVANTADTIAPSATISNPVNGAKVSGTVNIQGNASDNVGVASVALYIDGVLKASATGSNLSYSWNTRKASTGTHTIRLDARDSAGNTGSQSIQIAK